MRNKKCLIFAFFVFFLSGCYSRVGFFEKLEIGTAKSFEHNVEFSFVDQNILNGRKFKSNNNKQHGSIIESSEVLGYKDSKKPFLFYRECTKSGAAWLYECQIVGLKSIYQILLLINPQFKELRNVRTFFYPSVPYVRFEIDKRDVK